MATHTVTEGDCLSSIAEQYGFFWETLWNHPENAEIVRLRKDPNTLCVGDQVFIPEKRMKSYNRPTGARHTWKVKGVPVKFQIQLWWGEDPRADEPYVLTIEGEVHEGRTDGQGWVRANIPPNARRGSLRVGEGARETEFELELGAMPSVETITGVLGRLRNLGFFSGDPRDGMNDAARNAILTFQRAKGLEQTGEPDDATKSSLRSMHDGV